MAALAANKGEAYIYPLRDQVRQLARSNPARRRTTASARSRPRRVSSIRPARAAFALTSSSAMSPATASASGCPELVNRQPLADSRAQQDRLDLARDGVERLATRGRGVSRGDPLGIGRGMLDVPPAHAADVAVRARTDAPPVVPLPVGEVVAPTRGLRPCSSSTLRTSRSPACPEHRSPRARTCRPAGRRAAARPRRGESGPASFVPSSTMSAYAEM